MTTSKVDRFLAIVFLSIALILLLTGSVKW